MGLSNPSIKYITNSLELKILSKFQMFTLNPEIPSLLFQSTLTKIQNNHSIKRVSFFIRANELCFTHAIMGESQSIWSDQGKPHYQMKKQDLQCFKSIL